jgi:hypothetical protein
METLHHTARDVRGDDNIVTKDEDLLTHRTHIPYGDGKTTLIKCGTNRQHIE